MSDSSILVGPSWQNLPDPAAARVHQVVSDTVLRHKEALAQAFYTFMLTDAEAKPFFSVKAVEDRLKPGMERWLESLFCHLGNEHLQAMLAQQRHIGEVHARADIPVQLVARGMRLLKREIIWHLLGTDLDRDQLIEAVLRTDRLIDIAFEEMSAAFVQSHESGVRVDEAYRMFAAGHNLALERERQMGALLEWENRLFRAAATGMLLDELPSLGSSAFGLWLHHKAPLIFDQTRELPLIDECLQRIDLSLLPQFALQTTSAGPQDIRALLNAVDSEMGS